MVTSPLSGWPATFRVFGTALTILESFPAAKKPRRCSPCVGAASRPCIRQICASWLRLRRDSRCRYASKEIMSSRRNGLHAAEGRGSWVGTGGGDIGAGQGNCAATCVELRHSAGGYSHRAVGANLLNRRPRSSCCFQIECGASAASAGFRLPPRWLGISRYRGRFPGAAAERQMKPSENRRAANASFFILFLLRRCGLNRFSRCRAARALRARRPDSRPPGSGRSGRNPRRTRRRSSSP